MQLTFKKNNKKQYLVNFEVCTSGFLNTVYTLSAISFLPTGLGTWWLPQNDLYMIKNSTSNLPVKFDDARAITNDKATIYLLIVAYLELAKLHGLRVDKFKFDSADMLDENILSNLFGQLEA